MSRKSVVQPFQMFDPAADLSANAVSKITNVQQLDKASINITWTGTAPVGVITIQATYDKLKDADAVWFDIDFGGISIDVSGDTGDHQIIFNELPFHRIRINYAFGSGVGSMTAVLNAKVVGA